MRRTDSSQRAAVIGLCLILVATAGLGPQATAQQPANSSSSQPAPDWAYGNLKPYEAGDKVGPPCPAEAKPTECAYSQTQSQSTEKHELPGAPAKYTRAEAYNDYGPADWYPGDHPPMPDIVAHGREEAGIRACALCHFPNGQGKPENGSVAGLPAAYFIQQLNLFKTSGRHSSDPRKANTNEMAQIALKLTDEESKAAADYFASMQWRPWVKVIESETAPAVRSTTNGLLLPVEGQPAMPLGKRIIEVPANPEHTDVMRDPHSGFIAYVPTGSITRGETLVTTGTGASGNKTVKCGACHGDNLNGKGNIPGIAGRTTSYLMRQMWDFKQGTRKSPAMAGIVAKLDLDDLIDAIAYVSSRQPQ